jgi:hypothetical protein
MLSRWASCVALALMIAFGGPALAGETPSKPGAKAYFINLKDGDVVKSPVFIQFGLSGMGVSPAGVEEQANTGHHHLLVDTVLEGDALDEPIPSDAKHIHFGKGQTETTIDLPPGRHTLQIVLGDWSHVPHNPPVMSERITITVE